MHKKLNLLQLHDVCELKDDFLGIAAILSGLPAMFKELVGEGSRWVLWILAYKVVKDVQFGGQLTRSEHDCIIELVKSCNSVVFRDLDQSGIRH